MKYYNTLTDIKDSFDIFIFDAYGVFYAGDGFFENSLDVMKRLMIKGKTVCILSNSSKMSEDSIEGYAKKGLFKDKHYLEFVSTGTIINDALANKRINFKTKPNAKNVYLCSKSNEAIFRNTPYQIVDNLVDADFVLLSSLHFNNDEYEELKDMYGEYLFCVKSSGKWRATIIEPYYKKLDNLLSFDIPFLNPNPDYSAAEGVEDGSARFLITQGSFAKYLVKKGAEVIEVGKPYEIAYNYLFSVLENRNIKINKNRICMIGDTIRTDVKGANNVGIMSVLCIETGVTAKCIKDGEILENLIAKENAKVDFIINSVG